MPRGFVVAALLLLLPVAAAAETEVRPVGDRLEVRASAATVSEVLDRIARQTGMRVSYDGPPPRARVTLSGGPRTPAEAVLAVLEGQGLTYALRLDPTGTRVEMLMVFAGSGSRGATSPSLAPARMDRPEPANDEDDEPPDTSPAPEPSSPPEARPTRPGAVPFVPAPDGRALPLTPAAPAGEARPMFLPPMPAPSPSPAS